MKRFILILLAILSLPAYGDIHNFTHGPLHVGACSETYADTKQAMVAICAMDSEVPGRINYTLNIVVLTEGSTLIKNKTILIRNANSKQALSLKIENVNLLKLNNKYTRTVYLLELSPVFIKLFQNKTPAIIEFSVGEVNYSFDLRPNSEEIKMITSLN